MAMRLSASGLLASCGLTDPDTYVLNVDRLEIARTAGSSDSVTVRFVGYVGNTGCQTLNRVKNAVVGDSICYRFIGNTGGRNCFQKPIPLAYDERVASMPARTVRLVVMNRNRAPLTLSLRLPLP
ncbi:hypothetical protein [Gemmatimonas sp.]|uniref:hypothetical protein n=1 Tax=Gemmatimonas sp. TaxID=1962908 RepID=UPI00286E9F12|nr:hypothetical protein [Gemmatimonas sp.]